MERRSRSRVQSGVTIQCRVPASPVEATVQNVSADGCMIAFGDRMLKRGTTVILELADGKHVVGLVVWTELKTAGVKFEAAVSAADLAALTSNNPGAG
mgnify:CR=1 FL=1